MPSDSQVKHSTFCRIGGPLYSATVRKRQLTISKLLLPYSGASLPRAAVARAIAPEPPYENMPFLTHTNAGAHLERVALGLNASQRVKLGTLYTPETEADMLAKVLLICFAAFKTAVAERSGFRVTLFSRARKVATTQSRECDGVRFRVGDGERCTRERSAIKNQNPAVRLGVYLGVENSRIAKMNGGQEHVRVACCPP